MRLLWPQMLWSLLLVPVLVVAYLRVVEHRARQRAALGTMGEVRTRSGRPLGWRRHAPATVFLLGVTVLLLALSRPEATVDLPRREGTVVLAFDVSNSMLAEDIAPNRLAAAKRAARDFVESQPSSLRIGVVSFSTAAFEVQPPTDDRADVLDAIRRLRPEGGTALGRGIGATLNAIAGEPIVSDPTIPGGPPSRTSVPFLGSAAMILLSDGEDTTPADPLETAVVAAEAGVRIFTIGVGSAEGAVVEVNGFSVATQRNEELLQEIAAVSNGAYHRAEDRAALDEVYSSIDLRLTLAGERTEITALLAGAALVLFLIGAAMSMRWLGRVP